MIEIDNNSRVLFFGDSVTDIDFNRQYDHLLHGKQVYALNIGEEIKKKFPNAEVFYKGIVDDRSSRSCISVRFQLPTSSSVLLCFEQTSLSLS